MAFSSLRENIQSWYERRAVMRELRAFRRDDKPLEPIHVSVLIEKIKNAAIREDHVGMVRHWGELRDRFPDYAMTHRESIQALIKLKMYDEADQILTQSIKKFDGLPKLMELWGDVPAARGDHEEATRRWAAMRARYPDEFRAYAKGAISLKQLGRTEEATALLAQAAESAEDDYVAISQYALLASELGDWPEALRRWTTVRERFEDPRGWVEVATCLRHLGRLDEAEAMLHAGAWRFQTDPRPLIELAMIPQRAGDWAEAASRWERVRASFPQVPSGYTSAARALREAGRLEDAEAMLLAGIDRIGTVSAQPAIEYARWAHERRDWAEAVRRWEIVRGADPDYRGGYMMGAAALEALGRTEEANALRQHAPAE